MSFLLLADGGRIILGDGDGYLRLDRSADVVFPPLPRVGLVLHAELSPLDPVGGTRTTLRATNANIASETGLNDEIWRPAISEEAQISIRLFEGAFSASAEPGTGRMVLEIDQLEALNANVRRFVWAGSPIKLYAGAIGDGWPRTQVFEGIVGRQHRAEGNRLTLPIEPNAEPFLADILTETYAGTGDEEGGEDLKERPKPWLLGRCFNVEPVLINTVDSVFHFSAYGAIEAVTTLYENGSDFGASIGDYADYAALVAASIPEGRWATCLAEGMVRLGAPQAGVITGDVDGDSVASNWLDKTGEIITRVATNAGAISQVDTASLTALDTALSGFPSGGQIGVYISEQETLLEFANRMAAPCNAQAGVSWLGKLFVSRIGINAASITLDAQQRQMPRVTQSVELGVSPPFSQIEMGYAKNWRVQSKSEIAYAAELIERGLYDAAETYREGNIVTTDDNARWVYINTVAGSGNAPPTWPTTSNAYWANLTKPVGINTRILILEARVHSPRDMSDVERYLLIATDAGATATISVARHAWDYPNDDGDVTRELASITGLSFDTDYYIYFDDDTLADGSPSYLATSDPGAPINSTANPDRHYLGSIRTPADGGADTFSNGVVGGKDFGIGVALNYVQNANDNNATVPTSTGSFSAPVKYQDFADGNVSYEATFTYQTDADPNAANNYDGFARCVYAADTGAAYTLLGPGTAGEEWPGPVLMPLGAANYTLPYLVNRNPVKHYTIGVAGFRKVSKDIDPKGYILGPIIQYGPFQPATVQAMSGSGITIGGETADDVGTGASRANTAIDSDNAIALITKIGGSGGQTASAVSTGAARANAGLESDGTLSAGKAVTESLVSGAVNDLIVGVGTSDTDMLSANTWYQLWSIAVNVADVDDVAIEILFVGQLVFGTNGGSSAGTVKCEVRIDETPSLSPTPEFATEESYFPSAGLTEQRTIAFSHVFSPVDQDTYDIDIDCRRSGTASSGFAYMDWKAVAVREIKR